MLPRKMFIFRVSEILFQRFPRDVLSKLIRRKMLLNNQSRVWLFRNNHFLIFGYLLNNQISVLVIKIHLAPHRLSCFVYLSLFALILVMNLKQYYTAGIILTM